MKTLFYLIILFLVSLQLKAQNPIIEFDTTFLDFGTVCQYTGVPIKSFRYHNRGDAPLLIYQLKQSGSNFSKKWSKEPVMPGESGEIIIRFDNRNLGQSQKTIRVFCNDTTQRTLSLFVKIKIVRCQIKPIIQLDTTVLDFGDQYQGSRIVKRSFVYHNVGDDMLVIKRINRSGSNYTTHYNKEPLPPGEKGEIEVRISPQTLGPYRKSFSIHTNDTSNGLIVLTIKMNVIPRPKEESGSLQIDTKQLNILKLDTFAGKGIRPYSCYIYSVSKKNDTTLISIEHYNEKKQLVRKQHVISDSSKMCNNSGRISIYTYKNDVLIKTQLYRRNGDSIITMNYYNSRNQLDSSFVFRYEYDENGELKEKLGINYTPAYYMYMDSTVVMDTSVYGLGTVVKYSHKRKYVKRTVQYKNAPFYLKPLIQFREKNYYNAHNQVVKTIVMFPFYTRFLYDYNDNGTKRNVKVYKRFGRLKETHIYLYRESKN